MIVILKITSVLIALAVITLQSRAAAATGQRGLAGVISSRGSLVKTIRRHVVGILVLGAASVVTIYPDKKSASFLGFTPEIGLAIPLAIGLLLAVTMAMVAARESKRQLPPVEGLHFREGYLLIRAVYLAIYEIFFRVGLLQLLLGQLSVGAAVALNTALYVLAHSYSQKRELVGALPFGIVLCYFTLSFESVWPAVLLHLAICLPYEWRLLNLSSQTKTTNHEDLSNRSKRLYRW